MTHSTTSLVASTKQPVLFIVHGAGPCFFMDWDPADAWNGMAAHLAAGAALSVLRDEGVLSGGADRQFFEYLEGFSGHGSFHGISKMLIFDHQKKRKICVCLRSRGSDSGVLNTKI